MVMLNRRSFLLAAAAVVPIAVATRALTFDTSEDGITIDPIVGAKRPTLEHPQGDRWSVMWRDPARGYGQVDVDRLPRYSRVFVHGGYGPAPTPFWGVEAASSPSGQWARVFQMPGDLPSTVILVRHHDYGYQRNPRGDRFMRAYV